MKSLYALARSPRVAVALILLVSVLSLVFAGRPDFFRSVFFLAPVALFTISLGACAVSRVAVGIRRKARWRAGPDLIHLGLLVLVCGGLLTTFLRRETLFPMTAGDHVQIGASRTLRLVSLDVKRYEDGSVRDWISTVDVTRAGRPEVSAFAIRVNAPLRLRGITVYQSSWAVEGVLDLTRTGQDRLRATTGQGFQHDGFLWYFAGVEPAQAGLSAVFEQWKDRQKIARIAVPSGSRIGPFTVLGVSAREVAGLKVVSDPGFPVFIAAIIVIAAGLGLTLLQRKGEPRT